MLPILLLLFLVRLAYAYGHFYQATKGKVEVPEINTHGSHREANCSLKACCVANNCNAVFEESEDVVCYYGPFEFYPNETANKGWLKLPNATQCSATFTSAQALDTVASYKDLCDEECLQMGVINDPLVGVLKWTNGIHTDFKTSFSDRYGGFRSLSLQRNYIDDVCSLHVSCNDKKEVHLRLKSNESLIPTATQTISPHCTENGWMYEMLDEMLNIDDVECN